MDFLELEEQLKNEIREKHMLHGDFLLTNFQPTKYFIHLNYALTDKSIINKIVEIVERKGIADDVVSIAGLSWYSASMLLAIKLSEDLKRKLTIIDEPLNLPLIPNELENTNIRGYCPSPGEKVLIVFHVFVTGHSLLKGCEIIKNLGATPVCLTIVNRDGKYQEDFKRNKLELHSLLKWEDFPESVRLPNLPLDLELLSKQKVFLETQGILKKPFFLESTGIPQKSIEEREAIKKKLSIDVFLEEHTDDVLEFIDKYKFLGKSEFHLKKWLSQFESKENMDIAFSLLREIEFYTQDIIRLKLKSLHEKLKDDGVDIDNSIFLGLGRGGKSGQNILYFYKNRELNAKPIVTRDASDIFHDDPIELSKKTIIFVDDIIGINGTQAIRYFKQFFSTPTDLEKIGLMHSERMKKLDETLAKIPKYYLAIVGFETGIKKLKKEIDLKILVEDIYTDEQKAFSFERNIFGSKEKTKKAKEIIKNIGEQIYPEGALGWDDNEALIVFHHNIPTNTLPIFWSNGTPKKEWYPLFERYDVAK